MRDRDRNVKVRQRRNAGKRLCLKKVIKKVSKKKSFQKKNKVLKIVKKIYLKKYLKIETRKKINSLKKVL